MIEPLSNASTPSPISTHEKTWPSRALKRVPRLRSPVSFQAIARAIRPPSSGKAGTRLKASRNTLTTASQPISATVGVESTSWKLAVSTTPENCDPTAAAARQATTISAVTAGPAAATWNSSFGVCESRLSLATPPNSHRSMPAVSIPWRRAIRAWPSSCSSSEKKNSIVADTAIR